MLPYALLEELRYKGEGSDLDYKPDRYLFDNATDEEKSVLLKDILALANSHRDSTAYLLIGFKKSVSHPAKVVGLSSNNIVDDASLQEFVNGKLESKLNFRYDEQLFDGKHIAVISIPKQQRPFYLKKDYGTLSKDTVYVRRGRSTEIASPREIALMAAAYAVRSEAHVRLSIQTPENQPLPCSFERKFLIYPEDLPDYTENFKWNGDPSIRFVNKEYWRATANFHSYWGRVIQVRLTLSNQSNSSLCDAYLEVRCCCPEGESVLLRLDDLPAKPVPVSCIDIFKIPRPVISNRQVKFDERGVEPVAYIMLGTLRPGQTTRIEDDLAILLSGPGHYCLQVRILANEISTPILIEHPFKVTGPKKWINRAEFLASLDSENTGD